MNNPDTKDPMHDTMVQHHGPQHTEPHLGQHGTSFEGVDARAGLVIWSLAIIGFTLVLAFALTVGIQRYLEKANPAGSAASPIAPERVVPPSPQIQVHPWEDFPDVRAHEDQVLNSYGRDSDGHTHIPIDKAIDSVVSRLNIAPNAPVGITTPGGEGRDFSGSVNSMPTPYRRPQIQGEIRKNAQ
jgi:hypothetical protein